MDKTTTKVRIVFDGSAKSYDGISLNDTLLPGPPLQPDLLGVLIRFRKHKVALVADIEKMFLQIQMNPEDQDLQRFLWRNLNTDKPPDEYRLKTVTFGLKCSPFSSIKTIFKHIESEKDSAPTAAKEIRKNIFVDDILTGAETEKKAAELSIEMKQLLKRGGFPLRKFVSNKPKALKRLNPEDLATYHTVTMAASESSTTALGVKYLPKEDVLMFSFYEKLDNVNVETRRTFLKQLHRIYDPMGLLAPFTLIAKQLFQRAWTSTCEWDQPLPHELVQELNTWKDQVPVLDQIKVNRCYVPEHFTKSRYTLHAFGDACEASYGAVVYIRIEDVANATISVANVCAKTRVAPLKTRRSLPELELTASLLAARLVQYVEREIDLPIESVFCWSDSRVALEWISRPSYIWQTFVANRVAEIQGLVEPSKWKHIAGKNNPADLCSRGCNARTLVQSMLWWNGPEFLKTDESSWPKQENVSNKSATDTANKKRKSKNVTAVTLSVNRTDNQLVDYVNKFSSYNKFIGVFTRVRSWLKKHRSKIEGSYTGNPTEFQSIQHRQEEEIFWIKWAQLSAYHEEIDTLKAAKLLPKSSKLGPLDPFWDKEQQLLRVGGRLQNSVLPEETKNPTILPSHNYLTDLLVMYYHITNCHSGVVQTLAAMRCKYWLIRGRQEIRRIIHNKCRVCKELSPMKQKIAPLPADRVREVPPFTHVGVDFAGPLYVKVDKEQNKKAYITLFTCMITRAVHLELVPDMTTNEFLRALERMIDRRGKCSIIYSDNAKTFKKASKLLFQIFNNPVNRRQIEDGLTGKGIKWRFITEHAPWHGGFYERMVRSVKTPLKKVLGKARLTYTEMETVLTDIEAQINSRPLTDVSADKEDPLPLTPGHLVIGKHLRILPDIPMKLRQTSLGKRWNYQQRLSKQFWNRWNKEYLLELNKLQKWTEIQDNLKVGDVVLIAHDNMKKQEWILGKVVETHPGRDELVRSLTLKTPSGLVRRPIQRLRLLEAPETECK